FPNSEFVGMEFDGTILNGAFLSDPSNLVVDSKTYDSAVVTWKNPEESDLKTIKIYNPSLVYTSTIEDGFIGATRTATINGLAGGTNYNLRFTATDSMGNESNGSFLSFQTDPLPDTTPPNAPTGLSAIPTNGNVALDWDASISTDVAGYNVYKNGVKVSTGLVPSLIYSLAVPNNVTYTWTVTAVDTSGNESTHSAPVVTLFDTVSPSAPIGLALEPNGPYSVLAVWQQNAEPDLAGYSIYLNGAKLNTTWLIAENQYSVGNLQEGSTYNFQVSATDTNGNESPLSTPVSYSVVDIPLRPAQFRAAISDQKVVLAWTASPGATTYTVYRDDVEIAEIGGTSYSDAGLTNNQTYKYDVVANRTDKVSPKATLYARPVASVLDFTEIHLPFGMQDALVTAVNFLRMYGSWVLLGLGVLFAPILWMLVSGLMRSSAKNNSLDNKGERKRTGREARSRPNKRTPDQEKVHRILYGTPEQEKATKMKERTERAEFKKWVKEQAGKQVAHRKESFDRIEKNREPKERAVVEMKSYNRSPKTRRG
ncbi:fibronectin type III domain-containing protein, partial [Paenibacillus agricola]